MKLTKVTCELRALEPVPGSADADGGPAGAARTKCRGLSASEANAGAVLIEERAATLLLTQFFIRETSQEPYLCMAQFVYCLGPGWFLLLNFFSPAATCQRGMDDGSLGLMLNPATDL